MERVVFVITLVFGTLMAAPQREQLSKNWSDHAVNHQDLTLCLGKFGTLRVMQTNFLKVLLGTLMILGNHKFIIWLPHK